MTTAWPARQAPLARSIAEGVEALSPAELVAALTGARGPAHLERIYDLLAREGGVSGLARAEPAELARRLGSAAAARLACAFELSRRAAHRGRPRAPIETAADAADLLRPVLGNRRHELFVAVLLDARHRPRRVVAVARGGLTTCSVSPTEVLSLVLRDGAAGVLCGHNHPSGDPAPSEDDRAFTARLDRAATDLGVRFVDHLVIGDSGFYSFREREPALLG